MKKILFTLLVMMVLISTATANGSQETLEYGSGLGSDQGPRDGSGRGAGNGSGRGNSSGVSYRENFTEELSTVYQAPIGSGVLTSDEKEGLLLMSEEEKLARDVYTELYETWNLPIFRNIAESEQQHMDAIEMMMEAYELPGAASDEKGSFVNEELSALYTKLTEDGSESLSAALQVGALIEDLDIADLQKLLGSMKNEEVKILYQNLMKGSRNHLRSFTAQLNREDISYETQYITEEYYDQILSLNREIAPIGDPDYSL
jgi:hypothetical protein